MEEMVTAGVADEISVVDVYDLASDIGKECEKIIDSFGPDSVTLLMPKVINALELLEAMATKNEMENAKIQELTDRITYLESDKQEKAIFRDRFQKELEAIEEEWRNESNELMSLVSRLEEENGRYKKELQSPTSPKSSASSSPAKKDLKNQKIDMATSMTASLLLSKSDSLTNLLSSINKADGNSNNNSISNGNDIYILQRLRGQIDKHREELKVRERELQDKTSEIENLTIQLERLKQSGRDTRKRQKLSQTQLRTLIDERADFLAQLQDQQREIVSLRKRLGVAQKENEDLINSSGNSGASDDDERRARYTTLELKEIFRQRDDLRIRVMELEEELKLYKPVMDGQNANDVVIKKPDEPKTCNEEDAPVQGPLPYEPDDAPWKRTNESGIRKFFRKLFTEPDGTSSFPRRSLSTLSKMALSANPYSDTTI